MATRTELEQALVNADRAGDTEAATALAIELKRTAEPVKMFGGMTIPDIRRQLTAGGMGGAFGPDILMGARQVLDAIAQLASHGTGLGIKETEAAIKAAKEAYDKGFDPENTPGSSLARGAGQALATGPLMPAKAAAGLLASTGQAGITGGALGALTPVYGAGSESDFWREKLKDTGMGAALGAGLNVGVRGIARALSPAITPQAKMLQDEGVLLTPGQTGGRTAKVAEEKARSIPIVGDAITSAQKEGLDTFNQALYARTLRRLSPEAAQTARTFPVGNEGIKKTGDYLSSAYDEALALSKPAPVTKAFKDGLDNLQRLVPKSVRDDFADNMQRVVFERVTPGNTLTPSEFKAAESELGQLVRSYKVSQNANDRLLADAYREAQAELRSLMASANPQTAPRIQAINQGWADLVPLEKAGARIGSKEGVVTPAAYRSAVQSTNATVRHRGFARGEARNQAFADAADAVLSSRYPDSGTAGRIGLGLGALGGAAMFPPAAAAGAAAIPYLPYIRNLMTQRPDVLNAAGTGLRKASPYLAAPAAAGLLGLFP